MCLIAYLVHDVLECIQLLFQLELDDFQKISQLGKFSMKKSFELLRKLVELFGDGNLAAQQVTS
jgi:hypothetical protein